MNLPKRRKAPKMSLRDSPHVRCPGHLAWVRGHECAALDVTCAGRIETAHVRVGTDGGTGLKPGDNWTIPLCATHHAKVHRHGERTFELVHQIDMKKLAQEMWAMSPHRRKLEQGQ